jgi:hypothetical protein
MNLKVLDQPVSARCPEPAVCEACGTEFACGATLAGCWCGEIKLSDGVRAELSQRYERCLCRACLESFADGIVENTGRVREDGKEEK